MAQETDLKSVGLIACGFDSRLRHHPPWGSATLISVRSRTASPHGGTTYDSVVELVYAAVSNTVIERCEGSSPSTVTNKYPTGSGKG